MMMYYADVYIGGRTMVRTQIYLTEQEKEALIALSALTGKKQSEIIREAIDGLIEKLGKAQREAILEKTAGMWRGRRNLPNFERMRRSWDRGS